MKYEACAVQGCDAPGLPAYEASLCDAHLVEMHRESAELGARPWAWPDAVKWVANWVAKHNRKEARTG